MLAYLARRGVGILKKAGPIMRGLMGAGALALLVFGVTQKPKETHNKNDFQGRASGRNKD
jgi:hypothetical protein